jgi:O-antigen/teichoic acid export membrane protein
MQKKFFSNLVLLLVLNLLIKPIAIFGIDTGVQNRVGAEEYGLYFTLLNLSFLFNIILDLGINNFTTKNVAQYPLIVSRYIGKMLSFRVLLFVVYAIVSFGVAFLMGYKNTDYGLLGLLVLNQFFVVLIAYIRSHFAGFLYFRLDAIFSVLDRLLLIIICGTVFILTNEFQIEWFVWMQTACYSIVLVAAFIVLKKKIGISKVKLDIPFAITIVRKSLPYALFILLMMFYTRMDSIMVERIHHNGPYEVGIYAQGFRLLDAFFVFGMLFAGLLLPLFSHQMKDKEENQKLLIQASKLLLGGAILLSFLSYFNAETILSWIYKNDVESTIPSFQWLMLSFIAMGVSLIFGTYLTAAGELKFLNRTAATGILVNLGLNLYWIPTFGAQGAAWATFITQVFIASFQTVFVVKTFGTKAFQTYGLQLVIVLLIFWFGLSYAHAYFKYPIVTEMTIGIIILVLLRFWNVKEMYALISRKAVKSENYDSSN